MTRPVRYCAMACAAAALLAGCMVGPDYKKPPAPTPAHYKEAAGWEIAQPKQVPADAWWSIYGDPTLGGLESQVAVDNQNLKQEAAAYQAALAAVQAAQSGLFPTVSADATAGRTSNPASAASSSSGAGGASRQDETQYELEGTASWAPDLWGKVRRTVESESALAQASSDDLAAARLSAQALLATDYFELRAADQLHDLLGQAIDGYQETLKITQNQYAAGTIAETDVITAETQLEGAQAQQINAGVQRAQLEHAIAVLIGKPPADFSVTPASLASTVPVVPPGMPSALLERRPDVAAAERTMASANAQIGEAQAAFYPTLNLTAAAGTVASTPGNVLNASNSLWSLGADLAETIFDGGARTAAVEQAKAVYDEDVASYRETVLTAFQQVEDALAELRILEQQAAVDERAVASAQEALRLTLNQYQAGTTAYTSVVTAQATLVADQQNALTVLENRLTDSVALIQALGGGWSGQAAAK